MSAYYEVYLDSDLDLDGVAERVAQILGTTLLSPKRPYPVARSGAGLNYDIEINDMDKDLAPLRTAWSSVATRTW